MTSTPERRERSMPSLGALMVLIAASGLGFWLALPNLRENQALTALDWLEAAWTLSVGVLGGLSLVGPPLLLWESRRARRRWGPGKLHWFIQGTSSWLMWPPVLYHRFLATPQGMGPREGITQVCYFYGTPMMGLYVLIALIAGGRLRRVARRRLGPSWRERFGLAMGALWAIIGVGVLISLYVQDLAR